MPGAPCVLLGKIFKIIISAFTGDKFCVEMIYVPKLYDTFMGAFALFGLNLIKLYVQQNIFPASNYGAISFFRSNFILRYKILSTNSS